MRSDESNKTFDRNLIAILLLYKEKLSFGAKTQPYLCTLKRYTNSYDMAFNPICYTNSAMLFSLIHGKNDRLPQP